MVRGAELKLTAVELLADNGHLLLGDVNLALPVRLVWSGGRQWQWKNSIAQSDSWSIPACTRPDYLSASWRDVVRQCFQALSGLQATAGSVL